MNIEPPVEPVAGPATTFTGDVTVTRIAAPKTAGQQVVVSRVRFAPGAHTAWHSHALGQTLHVTEGTAIVATRDGNVVHARPGETIYTPPGEEHWHGATTSEAMEHLAIIDQVDPDTTTWLEHVTDDEYGRAL